METEGRATFVLSKNPYPYLELLPLLNYRMTPKQYMQVVEKYTTSAGKLRAFNIGQEYWKLLKTYTFAYCPFCAESYQQRSDTYSLLGWSGFSTELHVKYYKYDKVPENYPNIGCEHLFATQQFLNLHNNSPHERKYISCESGEVPYLTNWFFHDDLETRVVLHALPICRIEDDQFVPSYTVFSLTYFCSDKEALRHRHFAWQAEFGKGDREFYPAGFAFPNDSPTANESYDLPTWAQRGQLGYMDYTHPDVPLRIGVGTMLPTIFQDIQGRRFGYIWRDGNFKRVGPRFTQ